MNTIIKNNDNLAMTDYHLFQTVFIKLNIIVNHSNNN